MNVKELIEKLETCDPEAPVYISHETNTQYKIHYGLRCEDSKEVTLVTGKTVGMNNSLSLRLI